MFQSARLKLTIWYVLIIMVISGTVSTLFYLRATHTLELEYARVEQKLMRQWHIIQGLPPEARQALQEDLRQAKGQIAFHLFTINGVILILVGGLSYFLAGKTLQPIETAHEAQKRFVGDAAHELKTPLTALKTSIEVNLMDKSLPTKMKMILQENLEDVVNLERLTESLLRLAKVSDQQLNFKPVSLSPIVKQSVKQIRPLAQKKEITLRATIPKEDIVILSDPGTLTDLLFVFLDNAIKYSPKKTTITVKISSHKNLAYLVIEDQGVGIPTQHLPHIFDRFYRVDAARSSTVQPGHGLGLSIAQQIVTEHQGSISVTSQVGQGTSFTIKLPLART